MATLYTIGHSDHTLATFIELLAVYDIQQVVDVRSIPKSRHVPWFNKERINKALSKKGIDYFHVAQLGGLRKTSKNSVNLAWRNASFRGFADYMQTKEFFMGLKLLNQLRQKKRTAIMCAEAVPWRCHRSLIADAEVIRGSKVIDILSKTNVHEHRLTAFAVVDRSKRPMQIYYP